MLWLSVYDIVKDTNKFLCYYKTVYNLKKYVTWSAQSAQIITTDKVTYLGKVTKAGEIFCAM